MKLTMKHRVGAVVGALVPWCLGALAEVELFADERVRVERIERLLELDQFIELPDETTAKSWIRWLWGPPLPRRAISHIGVSQELWVEVMGHNPSKFKERKYCPYTYKEMTRLNRDGIAKTISMCADLPVDRVQAKDEQKRNSDTELIDELNRIFKIADRDISFRRATFDEYIWADTEGGQAPKVERDPDLWKYTTYASISHLDPASDPALGIPLPSGEHQPHGVKAKIPNSLGFYRSGVAEWADDMNSSFRFIMGGAWSIPRAGAVSGDSYARWPRYWNTSLGAGRLVMTGI